MLASRTSTSRSERGAAYVEFLIAAPFLFMLSCCVYDLGRVLNQYLLLTHAVNGGVRYAMGVQNLSEGAFIKQTAATQNCDADMTGAETHNEKHAVVSERVRELVELQRDAIAADVCIQTMLIGTPASGSPSSPTPRGESVADTVRVSLRAYYDGVFPLFKDFPINVAASAPYLLAPPATP